MMNCDRRTSFYRYRIRGLAGPGAPALAPERSVVAGCVSAIGMQPGITSRGCCRLESAQLSSGVRSLGALR